MWNFVVEYSPVLSIFKALFIISFLITVLIGQSVIPFIQSTQRFAFAALARGTTQMTQA